MSSPRDSVGRERLAALIVGCGPVGLAATIELARRGVPCLAVERHPGTAIHPKARGVNVRTMEIVRGWGIEGAVRAAGLSAEDYGFFFNGRSLVDPDFTRVGGGGLATASSALSPTGWLVISQDDLEPVLLDHARSLPLAEVRFGTEVVELKQTGAGVEARLRRRHDGVESVVAADVVIGADGANSFVRDALGVSMVGPHDLAHNISIYFEARLAEVVADRRSAVYYLAEDRAERPHGRPVSVGNPPSGGVLLTVDNGDRWLLVVAFDPEQGERLEDFDDDRCVELVRLATGIPALPVRVISLLSWIPSAQVAERYRVGRCFLAGDAAHQMTPSGAFGLNVGIGDVHNLGWKIAAVQAGWADDGLLETYHDERKPVGAFAADQSYRQFSGDRSAKPFGNWGIILGAQYDSAAVVPDGSPAPSIDDPAVDYTPLGRPGGRAPHAWLLRDGARISTLDLFGDGFVLLAGTAGASWIGAAAAVAGTTSIPLAAHRLGHDVVPVDDGIADYGIDDDGCVLVRPDGYVAWRSPSGVADPGLTLESVLRQVLRPFAPTGVGGRDPTR